MFMPGHRLYSDSYCVCTQFLRCSGRKYDFGRRRSGVHSLRTSNSVLNGIGEMIAHVTT